MPTALLSALGAPRDVAAIDIGSNSVRLVLYRLEGRAIWTVFNEKVLAGLGRDLASTGRLVGASAWFDGSQNDAASLAAGRVTIDYDYTPCAPAENIILNQRITDRFYAGISPSR